MLLGHVVKLDPLAMFLNCLGESSLSYRSLPTWLDLVPHGLHWLHALEVERVRDSDVVVGMVVVVVSYRVSSFQLQAPTSYTSVTQRTYCGAGAGHLTWRCWLVSLLCE